MVKIIAEIGINHNGDIELCKNLMMLAKSHQCDYVKIQKRTPEMSVPVHQKNIIKQTPWGEMTYLEYKKRIEFNETQIASLFDFASKIKIDFFASVWDIPSVDLMSQFTRIGKIPSAHITNLKLLEYARKKFDTLMISTGMSTEAEILVCRKYLPEVVFHTNSEYPSNIDYLNLKYITHLRKIFPNSCIGYSGHETSIYPTLGAVAIGSQYIERHITLDRQMWGSDQSSSLAPHDLYELVKGCHEIERAIQIKEGPRILFEGEIKKRKSLRGV